MFDVLRQQKCRTALKILESNPDIFRQQKIQKLKTTFNKLNVQAKTLRVGRRLSYEFCSLLLSRQDSSSYAKYLKTVKQTEGR